MSSARAAQGAMRDEIIDCYDPFFESSIHTFWHSQGLRLFADPGSFCPLCGKLVKQQSLDKGD